MCAEHGEVKPTSDRDDNNLYTPKKGAAEAAQGCPRGGGAAGRRARATPLPTGALRQTYVGGFARKLRTFSHA